MMGDLHPHGQNSPDIPMSLCTNFFHTPIPLPKGHRMAGSETTPDVPIIIQRLDFSHSDLISEVISDYRNVWSRDYFIARNGLRTHVYRVGSGLPRALTWTIDVMFCFLPILRLNQNLSFQLNKKKFHGERHSVILEGRRGNYERFETISAEGGDLTPERCLRQ